MKHGSFLLLWSDGRDPATRFELSFTAAWGTQGPVRVQCVSADVFHLFDFFHLEFKDRLARAPALSQCFSCFVFVLLACHSGVKVGRRINQTRVESTAAESFKSLNSRAMGDL